MTSPRPAATEIADRPRGPLAQQLIEGVARLLLEAAQHVPPPWPTPDPLEDPDAPALRRKTRRTRRRQSGGATGGRDDAGPA